MFSTPAGNLIEKSTQTLPQVLATRGDERLGHASNVRSFLNRNKYHERMMVDPMFMIVQNVRAFLTADTPTTVTPTVVILL